MPLTPSANLEPLAPLIGRWRTSGTVVDDEGNVTTTISGTDTYAVLPGGRWFAHDVDVQMGATRMLVHEVIGGAPRWRMADVRIRGSGPDPVGLMRLTHEGGDLFLLHGEGVRSWMHLRAGEDLMRATWERDVAGTWLPWMDMQFERLA